MVKKMLNALAQNFEDYVSAGAMTMMVIVLFTQVIARFVFKGAITWAEELSRFAFIWMMFLSASLAAKYRSHVRVTAVLLVLPKAARKWVIFGVDILWTVFNIVMVVLSIEMIINAMKFTYLSPSLKINMVWMFLVIPVSFLFMSIRIVWGYINVLRGTEDGYDL